MPARGGRISHWWVASKRPVRDGPGSDDRGVVELREIEAFLVLAEELHFGRTAQRLRVSQGRVSQMIRALEREVGGSLFERSSRQVRLTRLGGRFRTGAELIHNEVEDTLRACRAIVSDSGWRLHAQPVVRPGELAERCSGAADLRMRATLTARSHSMNTAPMLAVVPQPFAA
jgi:DNA-binding transcriptional LysR family regulator